MASSLQEGVDLPARPLLANDDFDLSAPSQIDVVALSSDDDREDEGRKKRKRRRGALGESSVDSQIIKKKQAKPVHQGQARLIP